MGLLDQGRYAERGRSYLGEHAYTQIPYEEKGISAPTKLTSASTTKKPK
jgi:hypothetical protein